MCLRERERERITCCFNNRRWLRIPVHLLSNLKKRNMHIKIIRNMHHVYFINVAFGMRIILSFPPHERLPKLLASPTDRHHLRPPTASEVRARSTLSLLSIRSICRLEWTLASESFLNSFTFINEGVSSAYTIY